ncbi:MAG: TetR/AcrR family transcriptional regulator [Magnetospiraceae bacterium]
MPKQGAGDETRNAILNVAETLVAERGFYGTSLRDIGSVVGIANASLLYHYPSKNRIYAAVLARVAESLVNVAIAADGGAGNEAKRFARFYDALFQWGVENPGRMRIVLRETLDGIKETPADGPWFLHEFIARAAPIMAGSKKGGAFRKQDSELAVLRLLGQVGMTVLALRPFCAATNQQVDTVVETARQEGIEQMRKGMLRNKKK